jgi:hypothetical protein
VGRLRGWVLEAKVKLGHNRGMDDAETIARALDERHAQAQAAFRRKDLGAYSDLFAPDLRYERSDGQVIDRDRLMRDVSFQFERLSDFDGAFEREALNLDGGRTTETLTQSALIELSAFAGLLKRSWSLKRRGEYRWSNPDGVWRIAEVRVLQETMQPKGWRFGAKRT